MKKNLSHSRIAKKFIFLTVPPSVFLMVVLGISMGWYSEKQTIKRTQIAQQDLQKQLVALLIEPLQFFEYQTVRGIAGTAINNNKINYIHITDELGKTVSLFGEQTADITINEIRDNAEHNRTSPLLGQLEIGFVPTAKNQNIYTIPLVMALFSFGFLALLLHAVWNQVVAKPLDTLRSAMENSRGGSEQRVSLKSNDEFELIASAYNDMLQRVDQHRSTIQQHDALFQMLYHRTPAPMFSLNQTGKITRISEHLSNLLGYPEKYIIEKHLTDFIVNSPTSFKLREVNRQHLTIKCAGGIIRQCHLNLVEEPDTPGMYLGVLNDITMEMEASEKLELLANYDQLTGLFNQHAFKTNADQLLDENECWFLFIDLDNFKWVNDSHGHYAGDEVLKIMASRLRVAMPDALLSRFGGDEFVAIVHSNNEPLNPLLASVKAITSQPITLPTAHFSPSISIGVACYPQDADNYQELLQKADTAMYQAKAQGKNSKFIYNEFLIETTNKRNEILKVLQSPTPEAHIDVFYQPIVDSQTHRILGAEALMRLMPEELEHIPIEAFLQTAEESGHIYLIDKLVRRKAMQQLANWQKQNIPIHELHINVSALNFNNDQLARDIYNDLIDFKLTGSNIVVEITESAFITHPDIATRQLQKLKKLGVCIALDDFGKGYSSLSMLTHFPVDILKLDQSFFLGSNTEKKHLIIKHLITMAKELNISIVAEGVETWETAKRLESLNCNKLQGFLFSKPLSGEAFESLLQSHLEDWSAGFSIQSNLGNVSANRSTLGPNNSPL